jgi:RNA polymerase sigma factor (sigma-70 family)
VPSPFVPHPAFDLPDAEALVWRSAPELPPPPDVYLDRAAEVRPPTRPSVLLTRQEELVLFVRLNYARRRAAETADPDWAARARDIEDAVVRYNVGLVMSVAGHDEEERAEGLSALVLATRNFDAARGWKFSTYAMRAICRRISRLRGRQARRAARSRAVVCAGDEVLQQGESARSMAAHRAAREAERSAGREEERAERLRDAVARAGLTPDERHVLSRRLSGDGKPAIFAEIARELGLTKDRTRLRYESALAKVRAAYEDGSAPPEPSPRGA